MAAACSAVTPKSVQPVEFSCMDVDMDTQDFEGVAWDVSFMWVRALCTVSSASVAGKKLTGTQGCNLITIIEKVRRRIYLNVDEDDQSLEVVGSVLVTLDGKKGSFLRDIGISRSRFERALKHPLAHLFLKTHRVIEKRKDGSHACIGTLISVSHYEPIMPTNLEEAYWAEPVEQGSIIIDEEGIIVGKEDVPENDVSAL